jgi:hypothetical protein
MDSVADNNNRGSSRCDMDALWDGSRVWTYLKSLEWEEWAAIISVISMLIFSVVVGFTLNVFGR